MYAPIPSLVPVRDQTIEAGASATAPHDGRGIDDPSILILGRAAFRKRTERFGLFPQDRLRHLHVIGKTGSGKSTLLANLIAQDLARGSGLALLDPHGDLVRQVLALVPPHRACEVLLFAPEDTEWPISFNVFRQGRRLHPQPTLLASELLSVFRSFWSASWGPRLEHVLRNAILAIAPLPQASLLYLYRFITDEGLREKTLQRVTDPVVLEFWTKEFEGYGKQLQAEATAPVLNKLGAFIANPIARNIVGQERSRLDLRALMNGRGILLANLSTGSIGEDASRLLGALLLTSIQLAAWSRGRAEPPFYLYIDEFQRFVTDSIATMLAESRKFGIGLTLAHQYLGQLPPVIRDAAIGNVGSSLVFRLGAADADVLAPEYEPVLSAADLQQLEAHHAAVRVLARGRELTPFTARMLPPVVSDRPGRIAEIVRHSRERFARPRSVVEQVIGGPRTSS